METDYASTLMPMEGYEETTEMPDANNSSLNMTYDIDTYLSLFLGPKHLPLDVVIPITVVYVVIFVSGVVGNVAVCVVIIRNPSMHTATNCYLFSLAISDLTVLLLGLPNDLSVYWQQYPWVLGEFVCKLRALIAEMTSYASVLTIVAFSLERYLAICHPLLAYTMSGLSRAARIVALIWLVALISALPFAIYTGITYADYPPGSGQLIAESAFCALLDENRPEEWPLYEMATFIFFIIPMGILCLLYLRIGIRIRRTSFVRGRIDVENVARHGTESRQASCRKNVLRMLVAVVIGFFVCWAPFHAQRLLYVYAKNAPNFREINEIMYYITGCFYYCSATINPILYNVMSVRYREAFRETLCFIQPPGNSWNRPRSTTQSRYTGCNSSDNWSTVPRRLSEGQRMHPPNGLGVTSVTDDVKNEMMSFLEEKRLDNAESDGPNVGFELIRISQETRQPTESALPSSAGRSATLQILANNGAGLQEKNKVMEWRNPINVTNPNSNLTAGCTPSCLKSSQIVRRLSETKSMGNRIGLATPPIHIDSGLTMESRIDALDTSDQHKTSDLDIFDMEPARNGKHVELPLIAESLVKAV